MIRRSNTASGAYLLRRAAKLAKSVVPTYGSKSEVVDGYILRGRRANVRFVAEVLDPPAWLVLVGPLIATPAADVADSLVQELPTGRDALRSGLAPAKQEIGDRYLVTRPQGVLSFGQSVIPPIIHPVRTNEVCYRVPGIGTLQGVTRLFANQYFGVSPMAFVDRTARIRYESRMLVPQLLRVQVDLVDGQWVRTSIPGGAAKPLGSLTVLIDDSFLRGLGALPFCMRQSPPAYNPGSVAAGAFSAAQAPWVDQAGELYQSEDGSQVYRLTLWSQVVTEMLSDADMYGARALWFATVRVNLTAGTASLEQQFLLDPRTETNPLRRPRPVDNTYLYNAHLRVGGAVLNSGTLVVVDTYQALTDGLAEGTAMDAERRTSVDLLWVARAGQLLRRQTISEAVLTGDHDFKAPVGIATDGQEVVVFAFSTAFIDRPYTLDIIVANENTASVVFSEEVPFAQCLGLNSPSYYTTGHAQNPQLWGTQGAGGNQACYIGNGKYLFHISSQTGGFGTLAAGNVAAAIYNRATNTVSVAGVIDPVVAPAADSVRHMGKPDCVVQETANRKATVIATKGAPGQVSGEPGVEGGKTWISYDSGETWELIADYGSPSGVVYSGNLIQSR